MRNLIVLDPYYFHISGLHQKNIRNKDQGGDNTESSGRQILYPVQHQNIRSKTFEQEIQECIFSYRLVDDEIVVCKCLFQVLDVGIGGSHFVLRNIWINVSCIFSSH